MQNQPDDILEEVFSCVCVWAMTTLKYLGIAALFVATVIMATIVGLFLSQQ